MPRLRLILAALAFTTSAAAAQDPRSPATSTECSVAIAALHKLAAAPKSVSSVHETHAWTATRCGAAGGAALADLVPFARPVSDTLLFARAEAIATDIADSSLANAFLRLAADPTATATARVFALRVLARQQSPGTWIDGWSAFALGGAPCRTRTLVLPEPFAGAPFAADFAVRIGAAATALAADAAAPAMTRGAARCVARIVSATLDVPPGIDAAKLQVEYLCGNRFRVRNGNAAAVDLSFEVEGADENGDFTLQANGERILDLDNAGTLRLYLNPSFEADRGRLLRSVSNGGTACPD